MQQTIIKQKHLSGYDLTTKLIRGGLSNLNLSPNTKLVLLYLSTCYNEKKGVVFPKIKTIAEAIGIAEISVKRAIKELLKENCILKAKRFKNSNEYILTNKILETSQIDTKEEQIETSRSNNLILPIEHELKQEEIKEQQLKEEKEIKQPEKVVEVVFSSNSPKMTKPLDLQAIPTIIRENKNIKCPAAYWRSLDENAKLDYIRKEKETEEKRLKQLEQEKLKEQKSYENYLKAEQAKTAKPFSETCSSSSEAEAYIKKMYGTNNVMRKVAHKSRIVSELVKKFNLNLEELLTV